MDFSDELLKKIENARDEPECELEEYSGKANTIPFVNQVSPNRSIMYSSAMDQFVEPIDGDIPDCNTVYAKDIYRSTENIFPKDDMEVLHIIPKIIGGKQTCVKAYILKDKNDTIHLFINEGFKETNESYGFRVDSHIKEEGQVLEKEETILRPHAYDENGIYRGGVNANTIFVTSWENLEDAFMMSESLAKKAANYKVFKVEEEFDLNNCVLKNLYGDLDNYQPFPLIGEKIRNNPDNKYANTSGFLMCYSTNTANHSFVRSNRNLMKVSPDDEFKIYPDGSTVVDITVRKPLNQEKIPEECCSEFLQGLIEDNRKYELKILDLLDGYVDKYELSPDTKEQYLKYDYIYNRTAPSGNGYVFRRGKQHGYVSPNKILVDMTLVKVNVPFVGQKFTGRHGNKGVCSFVFKSQGDHSEVKSAKCAAIFKDGTIKSSDGRNVDFIMTTSGVNNRANPGQLSERTINQMSAKVVLHLENNKDKYSVDDMCDIVLTFTKIFSDEQKNSYEMLIKKCGKREFIDYIIEHGFKWNLKPWSHGIVPATFLVAIDFMNEVGINYGDAGGGKDWIMIDGKKKFKAEVASMYLYVLKQDAVKKMSIRTKGAYNTKGSVTRTKSKKMHTEKYSSTPIKQSSDDMFIYMGMLDPDTVRKFFATSDSSIVETLNAHLAILGLEIDKDV